jgi:hypothetical protein
MRLRYEHLLELREIDDKVRSGAGDLPIVPRGHFLKSLTLHLSTWPECSAVRLTSREYTWPFGRVIGGLSSFMIFPVILQTMVELEWWLKGTSSASFPRPRAISPELSQTGQSTFFVVGS